MGLASLVINLVYGYQFGLDQFLLVQKRFILLALFHVVEELLVRVDPVADLTKVHLLLLLLLGLRLDVWWAVGFIGFVVCIIRVRFVAIDIIRVGFSVVIVREGFILVFGGVDSLDILVIQYQVVERVFSLILSHVVLL